MTTETISKTISKANLAWVTDEDITAETINRTYPTTASAKTINRTGPAWETDEEIFPKDPKSYMGLIFGRDWQTHLPPSPEGQMLASADYCPESGDVAHFILDPKSREIIIACFDSCFNEPDELRYFLLQEKRADGPGHQGRVPESPGPAQRQRQNRMVLPTIHQGPAQTETIPAHGTRPHPRFWRYARRPQVEHPVQPEVQRGYPIIVFLYGMRGLDAYHPPERRPHPGLGEAPRHEAVLLPAD